MQNAKPLIKRIILQNVNSKHRRARLKLKMIFRILTTTAINTKYSFCQKNNGLFSIIIYKRADFEPAVLSLTAGLSNEASQELRIGIWIGTHIGIRIGTQSGIGIGIRIEIRIGTLKVGFEYGLNSNPYSKSHFNTCSKAYSNLYFNPRSIPYSNPYCNPYFNWYLNATSVRSRSKSSTHSSIL